jgi:tetratricopeptide (TPR) repeat protein
MSPTNRHFSALLLMTAAALPGCVQYLEEAPIGPGGCDAACWVEQGWTAYEAGDPNGINLFRAAINADSTYAEGYVGLGWYNIDYGFIDAAALSFQAATDIDTSQVAGYAGAAFSFAAALPRDVDAAILMAETALAKGGPDWVFEHSDEVSARSLGLLLAQIYFDLADYGQAQSYVDEVDPSNTLDPSSRTYVTDLLLAIVALGARV